MSDKFNKILQYHHGEKSLESPAIIYTDLKYLCGKMHSRQNDPEMILANQYLQVVHLTQQKTNSIVTKIKIV